MASSKAGFHQKDDGTLVVFDQLASGESMVMGAAENNLGGLDVDPATYDTKIIYAQRAPGDVALNSTSIQTLLSKSITLAAGDVIDFEAQFLILNNSGSARSFVYRVSVGSFDATVTDGATIASNANNRAIVHISGSISIVSTGLAYGNIVVNRYGPAAAASDNSAVLAQNRSEWVLSASDFTGAQTALIGCMGNNATATQTAHVIKAVIMKRRAVT